MSLEIVNPLNAPTPNASPAVKVGNMVYTAGQVGMDPKTRELVGLDIETQTKQTLENIKMLVEAAGSSMSKVVKCLVFITDMKNFQAMNAVYKTYFTGDLPARSCVRVDLARPEILVEIEAIATL